VPWKRLTKRLIEHTGVHLRPGVVVEQHRYGGTVSRGRFAAVALFAVVLLSPRTCRTESSARARAQVSLAAFTSIPTSAQTTSCFGCAPEAREYAVSWKGYFKLGASASFTVGQFGLRGGGAFAPVQVDAMGFFDYGREVHRELFGGYEVLADAIWIGKAGRRGMPSGYAGYRFHDLAGHGVAFGASGLLPLSRQLELSGDGGFNIFPSGLGNIIRHRRSELPGIPIRGSIGPDILFGVSVGLGWAS
jgi:hypothetical protein